MNLKKIMLILGLAVCTAAGVAFLAPAFAETTQPEKNLPTSQVEVIKKWNLPGILDEVSGIALIDEQTMLAVQDEEGVLFIYDLAASKITDQISFGDKGDYEGVTVAGNTAYVLRSDGTLFEINNYRSQKSKTKIYKSSLPAKINVEGLCYDKQNERLLMAVKEKSKGDYRPVYAFNLKTKQIEKEPAFKLHYNDPVFNVLQKKKDDKIVRPSEVNIHPVSGDIYILESVNPKIVVLNSAGNLQKLYLLDKNTFAQPEGLTFSSNGDVYISNEGKGGKATIFKVKLEK